MIEGYAFVYHKSELSFNEYTKQVRWLKTNAVSATFPKTTKWAVHDYVIISFKDQEEAMLYKLVWVK